MKNKIERILEHIKSILYLLFSILVVLGISVVIYGSVVYSDPNYIREKYPQRFAIDGDSLDLSSQFEEMNFFIDTEIEYRLDVTSSDFITEEMTPEVTIYNGDSRKPNIYENVNIKVYTNDTKKSVFNFVTPPHVWFYSKPDNNKWILFELTKYDKRYDLNISNINYNKELNLFVRIKPKYIYTLNLQDSDVTIIYPQKEEKENIHINKGSIILNGTSAIRFYNVSNILARNISEIEFIENTKIDTLTFKNGFGTFAMGQSHIQFTPIDEVQIVSSEKSSPVELKIDFLRKTFKASGYINSLKFNGNENILTNYQNILREPTFISAIVGAIIGGLTTTIFSRREKANKDAKNLRYGPKRYISSMNVSNHLRKNLKNR